MVAMCGKCMVRSFLALIVDCKCFFHDLIGSLFYAPISRVPASVIYKQFYSKRFRSEAELFFCHSQLEYDEGDEEDAEDFQENEEPREEAETEVEVNITDKVDTEVEKSEEKGILVDDSMDETNVNTEIEDEKMEVKLEKRVVEMEAGEKVEEVEPSTEFDTVGECEEKEVSGLSIMSDYMSQYFCFLHFVSL